MLLFSSFDLLSLQRQHPLPWSESELTISGMKVPGNIREHSFPRVKVPGNFRSWERRSHWELSLRGAKITGSEKS